MILSERHRSLGSAAPPLIVLIAGLWLIWRARYVPAVDYSSWIRQGRAFAMLMRGHSSSHYRIRPYPVPNSVVLLIFGLLDQMISPDLAGKILFSISLCLFVFGSVYLVTSLGGSTRSPAIALALSLTLGRWFFFGSLSYLLGLGLLSVFAGTLLRKFRSGGEFSVLFSAGWFVVLFFTHFAVLLAALAIAGPLLVARIGALKSALATVPTALLTLAYVFGLHHDANALTGLTGKMISVYEPAFWQVWSYRLVPADLLFTFAPFQAIESGFPATPASWSVLAGFNLFWCLLVLSLAGLSLLRAARENDLRSVAFGGILCFALVILAGRQLAGGDMGNRLLLPAWWIGLACFAWQRSSADQPRRDLMLTLTGYGVILAQLFFVVPSVRSLDRLFSADYAELAAAQSTTGFCSILDRICSANTITVAQEMKHPWLVPMTPVRRGVAQYLAMDDGRFDALVSFNDVGMLSASFPSACNRLTDLSHRDGRSLKNQ